MANENYFNQWRVIGSSVQGAAHLRAGLPNQDALGWQPERGQGLPVMLAISDGHGSHKSFRSDEGSRLAVEVALEALQDFLDDLPPSPDLDEVEKQAVANLPQRITQAWRAKVEESLTANPMSEVELSNLAKKESPAAVEYVQQNPLLAYGATLLAVLVAQDFILYVQIGDGDILCVDAFGDTSRPFARDERLIANETTSLCIENAWQEFRLRLIPASDAPVMILACTDGYSNSFRTEQGFLKIGQDYLQMIRNFGLSAVAGQLAGFLSDTSRQGSGDDITLGILKRNEPLGADVGLQHQAAIARLEQNAAQAVCRQELKQELAQQASANQQVHERFRALLEETTSRLNLLQHDQANQAAHLDGRICDVKDQLQTWGQTSGARFDACEGQLRALGDRAGDLQAAIEAHTGGIQSAEQRDIVLQVQLQNLHDSIRESDRRLSDNLGRHQEQIESLAGRAAALESRLVQVQTRQDEIEGQIGAQEDQAISLKSSLEQSAASLEAKIDSLVMQVADMQSGFTRRLADLEASAVTQSERLAALDTTIDQHNTLISQISGRLALHDEKIERLRKGLILSIALVLLGILLLIALWTNGVRP